MQVTRHWAGVHVGRHRKHILYVELQHCRLQIHFPGVVNTDFAYCEIKIVSIAYLTDGKPDDGLILIIITLTQHVNLRHDQ